ncbi:hypothetical protein HZH66_014350 [Vespula vulgaris]|uniref:Uncharacterized protein n=1 Tax=Vespula vulgaris TaxID=7454 RepID=A0A834MP37_VESVU|nr:hypothetical protein HZH66_014350 [Vespula vulgaris]
MHRDAIGTPNPCFVVPLITAFQEVLLRRLTKTKLCSNLHAVNNETKNETFCTQRSSVVDRAQCDHRLLPIIITY